MKLASLAAAAVLSAVPLAPALAGSLANVSIVDRTAGRELPIYWHGGQAWVVGQPGNEYQVRVRNKAGEDLLAVVSVDGVNAITGETAHTSQSGYVISRWRSLDVQGWRKSMEQTAAFYFTTLGDSYAARTGRPNDVGVIGVALFKRRVPPPPMAIAPSGKSEAGLGNAYPAAPAESAAAAQPFRSEEKQRRSLADSAPLGTGHGRREASYASYTSFERATEYPQETITIRYDSHANLVAMGVIPPAPRPHFPRPFPGFAPDPVGYAPFKWDNPGA